MPLERVIEVIGHRHATYSRERIAALRALGVQCADKSRRISRKRPVWPKRAILRIGTAQRKSHVMLAWDGEVYDPDGSWPDYPDNWTITSYLEIYE